MPDLIAMIDAPLAARYSQLRFCHTNPQLFFNGDGPMAKRAAAPPPASASAEERFVELMLVAADFVKNCGGLEQAKKSLADAGQFIDRAKGVSNAEKALSVLENLRDKISA